MRQIPSDTNIRIAFVEACWHHDIVLQSRQAFVAEMARVGVPSDRIDVFPVPGSLEIPAIILVFSETLTPGVFRYTLSEVKITYPFGSKNATGNFEATWNQVPSR